MDPEDEIVDLLYTVKIGSFVLGHIAKGRPEDGYYPYQVSFIGGQFAETKKGFETEEEAKEVFYYKLVPNARTLVTFKDPV